MMKHLLGITFIALFLSMPSFAQEFTVTDAQISEITEKLQSLDENELKNRKIEIEKELANLQDADDKDSVSARISALNMELSIVEQLLILVAVAVVTNDGTDTPPDTVFPVITILGDNPADVELGSVYVDAGAESDGGETVTTSGTVDTNTLGTYTITYSATDSAGNTSTATRTVNVEDTTAPVFTSSATFNAEENQTAIGTVTATDLQSVTFAVSGSDLSITTAGVLSFVTEPDYETQTVYTATVTATDASSNSSTQDITVNVTNDESDDDTGTGTGTGTGSDTGTGSGTGTGTGN